MPQAGQHHQSCPPCVCASRLLSKLRPTWRLWPTSILHTRKVPPQLQTDGNLCCQLVRCPSLARTRWLTPLLRFHGTSVPPRCPQTPSCRAPPLCYPKVATNVVGTATPGGSHRQGQRQAETTHHENPCVNTNAFVPGYSSRLCGNCGSSTWRRVFT